MNWLLLILYLCKTFLNHVLFELIDLCFFLIQEINIQNHFFLFHLIQFQKMELFYVKYALFYINHKYLNYNLYNNTQFLQNE